MDIFRKTKPFLRVCYDDKNLEINLEDKVIVCYLDKGVKQTVTGTITSIGTKLVYVRTSPVYNIRKSPYEGRVAYWYGIHINIDTIVKIAKYPSFSQKVKDVFYGRQ